MLSLLVATSAGAEGVKNPLFALLVESFRSLKTLTAEHVWDLIINFPKNYETWWTKLFREAPQHILIETTLIVFIIWLVFIRRTVDPKKTNEKEKLSQREIDWLIETWQPEPLVPKLVEKELVALTQQRVIEDMHNDLITIRGVKKPVINASSFDFYGLSKDETVKQAARDALDHYGCGSCGPRGFYGTLDVHLALEASLAKFMNCQEAINYSEGASTVASAIPAFAKKGDLLLVDEACSEPVMTGVNLSRSTVRYFRHNDVKHLESILEAIAQEDEKLQRDTSQQRRFIVVEGLYRNVGDVCPLKEMLVLKEKYFYRMILEETASFGILGKTGRGITEHCGVKTTDVEIITFTLDTVLASVGGACVGTHEVVDHQRLSGAGYCFSASLAPFLCAGAAAALQKIDNDPSYITRFQSTAEKLFHALSTIPHLKLVSQESHGIYHLTLQQSTGNDVEDQRILNAISDQALQHGISVVASKYALLHSSKALKPTLLVTCSITWTDDTIRKIADALTKAARKVFN